MIYYFLNFRHTTGMGGRRHLSFLESEAMKAKALIIVSRKEKNKGVIIICFAKIVSSYILT